MIVALKELQIRGDIRTTIEYIIKLLQSEAFVENRIDTAWLDGRLARYSEIAMEENRLYCPPPTLVVTCGAALQGFQHFHSRDQNFLHMLRVGQVPTKDSLSPSMTMDLIYENVKYAHITCVQNGPERIIITCNGISQVIAIRPLADGGYLLNIGGSNHLVYSQQEESGGLRMILDGTTCRFTPEYDPTRFTSAVAGKIARLLVADGAHVNAGEAFVEIEVMKVYTPLKFCKPPEGIKPYSENLVEFLRGDRIENSAYEITMLDEQYCKVLCQVTLKTKDVTDFKRAIKDQYHHNWIVDNLPAASILDTDQFSTTQYVGYPINHNYLSQHQVFAVGTTEGKAEGTFVVSTRLLTG